MLGGHVRKKYNMAKNNMLTIIIVAAIAIFAFQYFAHPSSTPTTTDNSGNGCSVNPSWVATGIDALVRNSNVTPSTYSYVVDGVYKGTSYSTPIRNAQVQTLADATGYLADVKTNTVICGPNPQSFELKNYVNASVTVYNDAGTAVLTNAITGGANNETSISSSKTWRVRFLGTPQKSTSKIFWVVEMPASSAANMTSNGLTLNCAGSNVASIPNAVGATNANSYRAAWEIPELSDGKSVDCYLTASVIGGKTIASAGVYNTFYAEQAFIDTNGQVVSNGIYDANGNAKYQDKYTYNFYIGA